MTDINTKERRRVAMRAMSLEDETFGERMHRAYRQGRNRYDFTYREVADRISQVYPTSMQTLQRLERCAGPPPQARMRLVAYLALIAYGFKPEDFGLDQDTSAASFIDWKKARLVLDPHNGCSMRSEPLPDPENSIVSAGQREIGSSPNRTRRPNRAKVA